MMIGSVSSLSSNGTIFHPVLAEPSKADANAGESLTSLPPLASTSSVSSAPPVAAGAPAKTAVSSTASSSAAAASSDIVAEQLVSGYSTTIGKQTYSASVDLGSGEYTASVANLVGATATATTEQSAENNLGLRIDTLV